MINFNSIKDLTFEIIDKGQYLGLIHSRNLREESRDELLIRIKKTNLFIFTVFDDFDRQIRELKGELLGARVGFIILAIFVALDRFVF